MHWTITPERREGNHAPRVRIVPSLSVMKVRAGQTLRLRSYGVDPDRDGLDFKWWQYREEGTYQGLAELGSPGDRSTTVTVPEDARAGQTISIVVQATDDGTFPLTRYDRVILTVV
jgi:hypothetical protein